MSRLLVFWFLCFSHAALAQGMLQLDTVFVAPLEAEQPFLEPEAERVERLMAETLNRSYVVVPIQDVPPFEDYSAAIYLDSCPEGQYVGCVFVLGERATTEWAIGGSLHSAASGYRAHIQIIDVRKGAMVLEFDVELDGSNDAEFSDGLERVIGAVIAGEVEQLDIRSENQEEAAAAAAAAAAATTQAAAGLDEITDSPVVEQGRLTNQDLDDVEDLEGLTPWDRLDMSKNQYKRYRNSGKKLGEWRAKQKGRQGQMLFRVGAGAGWGPWVQVYDGWMRLEANGATQEFDVIEYSTLQEQVSGPGYHGEFSMGFGILPYLDIEAFAGVMGSTYLVRVYRLVPGLENQPGEADGSATTSWFVGGRVGFAPMMTYNARPTVHLGAYYWKGATVDKVVSDNAPITPLPANNMVLLQLAPGVEVDLSNNVNFFARANMDVPIAGRRLQSETWGPSDGSQTQLGGRPAGSLKDGVGFGLTVGILFRANLVKR